MPAWFGKTASNGVPARAVMIGSLLATLLVLTNSSRSMGGLFTFMALLTTSVTLWLYLACALVALKRRIAMPFALAGLLFGLNGSELAVACGNPRSPRIKVTANRAMAVASHHSFGRAELVME